IFYGEKLLTTGNPDAENDRAMLARLGLHPKELPPEVRASCG
ncbi:MAG: biotin synthase BioB, partial [Herbaspirillum sp.]